MTDRDKLLLKPAEAAERLSLSPAEVYRMLRDGRLVGVRVPDVRGTFVRASDLSLFVRNLVKIEAEKGS